MISWLSKRQVSEASRAVCARDGPEMDMGGRGKLDMVELCFEEV
jgi:hypothetical protein